MQASEYLEVMRARKWVIIWSVVIVTVGAFVVSVLQPAQYQGTATLLFNQRNPGTAILGVAQPQLTSYPDIEVATQVRLIQQREVLQAAIRALGLDTTPEKLLEQLTVAADGQTQLISITAIASTPVRAGEIANAVVTAYASWSRDVNRRSISAAAEEIKSSIAASARQIQTLEASAAAQPSSAIAAELQAADARYRKMSDQLQELQVAGVLEAGSVSVVTDGVGDPAPVSPKPTRNAAVGVAVGLMIGLGMALLANTLDSTVKSADDLSDLYGAPVLGQVTAERVQAGDSHQPIVLADPGGSAAESYRGLRNNFEFINFERSIRTILVTSAVPGEGKSTVAANLAVVLAQSGWRIALVAIDFRRAGAEGLFALPRSPGLSEVLAGTRDLASVIREPMAGLRVLSSGATPPNPSELLGSAGIKSVLATLAESVELIIVDAPPLLAVADAATAARWSDATLVVARDGLTTREAVRKARAQLDGVGEHIVGVVITGISETASSRDSYHAYSGYSG